MDDRTLPILICIAALLAVGAGYKWHIIFSGRQADGNKALGGAILLTILLVGIVGTLLWLHA